MLLPLTYPRLLLVANVSESPIGNTPSSTYSDSHSVAPDPPASSCAMPPVPPLLKLTKGLARNDLHHYLMTGVGPCDRSDISCNLGGYLDVRIKDLENMKHVCINADCSKDECPSIQSLPSSGCILPQTPSLLPSTTRDERRVVFHTDDD